GHEVVVLEEVLERPGDLLGRIDLAGLEPLEQILDGEIEVDDLHGLLDEAIGDRLADRDAGGVLDHVLERFEVLDVERADHVDPGGEDVEHVLVALLVLATRRVGVRDLVDDADLGLAGEDRLEIHLLDGHAPVLNLAAGHHFEPGDQCFGLGAAVGLDESEHDIDAALAERARLPEHPGRLGDPGPQPDVQLEPAPPGALHQPAKGPRAAARGHFDIVAPSVATWAGRPNWRSSARLTASTLTRGSPRKPSSRPSVYAAITAWMRSTATPRALAIRGACSIAVSGETCG